MAGATPNMSGVERELSPFTRTGMEMANASLLDEATAADILQRVASDGDTLDRNDFLHALVLWRSTARTRDRCVRNESACCVLA